MGFLLVGDIPSVTSFGCSERKPTLDEASVSGGVFSKGVWYYGRPRNRRSGDDASGASLGCCMNETCPAGLSDLVDMVSALFIWTFADLSEIRPILPRLLDGELSKRE